MLAQAEVAWRRPQLVAVKVLLRKQTREAAMVAVAKAGTGAMAEQAKHLRAAGSPPSAHSSSHQAPN